MLTIDFADPATNADPFPIFKRLRESDPVHWSAPMKVWVVTRYEDVKALALNNTEVSANRLAPFFAAVPESRRTGYASLIAVPEHLDGFSRSAGSYAPAAAVHEGVHITLPRYVEAGHSRDRRHAA